MNQELVKRLILYIVDRLVHIDAPVSTIRLVKYLYLIDREHFFRYRKTLTGIDWMMYIYGPYFQELPRILKQARIDLEPEEVITPRGVALTFRVYSDQDLEDLVDYATETLINRILERWAYEDIKDLLDYVYSETEPMRNAQYGKRLDFSAIESRFDAYRPERHIKLPKNISNSIQEMLEKHRREISKPIVSKSPYDDVYFVAMGIMNQEDIVKGDINGKVVVNTDAIESFRNQSE